MHKFEKDLTSGSVFQQLIRFSWPLLLSNFIQTLYNVADTMIVGWFSGPNHVVGVSNGGQLTLIVTNFVIGLTVGGTVLIGQYYGSKRREDMEKTMSTMLSILIVLAIALTVIVIAFAGPLLKLIRTPAEAVGPAKSYLIICMLGTLFIFGYNAISAILRGMGDSKNPLKFVTIAAVSNIFLDFLFIVGFKMGATGAALGTIIAQGLSLVLSMIYLNRSKFMFTFSIKNLRIDPAKLKLLLKIGLPNSLQNVVVSTSFLFMMALVNGYGVYASAAMSFVGKFNGFAILPAIAMSAAVSSMSAQNLGAGLPQRAKETMRAGIMIVYPLCLAFFLVAFIAPKAVLGVFTNDPQVIANGIDYIRYMSIDYLIVPFLFCMNGMLMGAGHTTFTMINGMMSSIILRVPLALIFGEVLHMGLTGIGLAAPVASIGALVVCFAYVRSGRWQKGGLHGAIRKGSGATGDDTGTDAEQANASALGAASDCMADG